MDYFIILFGHRCIVLITKLSIYMLHKQNEGWVPVSSTGKIFDGCIRDLGFNPRLHQKLIGVLV